MFQLFSRAASAVLTICDLLRTICRKRHRRFLILLPILMLIAIFFAVITSSGALAPFVYPLF